MLRAWGRHTWIEGNGCCRRSGIAIIGEAPGRIETQKGQPMIGPTGQELNLMLQKFLALPRDEVYVTNFCKTPIDNEGQKRKPGREEMDVWREILIEELSELRPRLVILLGQLAVEGLLKRQENMETINGVPEIVELVRGYCPIVVPAFHPAVIFRDSSRYNWIKKAFINCYNIVNDYQAEYQNILMRPTELKTLRVPLDDIDSYVPLAVDTETYHDGRLYTCQISDGPGRAAIAYMEDSKQVEEVNVLIKSAPFTIMHNGIFDLLTLRQKNITVPKVYDTAVLAFLLQTYPLKLKQLSYSLFGLKLPTYADVISGYRDLSEIKDKRKAIQYMLNDPDLTYRVYLELGDKGYTGMPKVFDRDMAVLPMLAAMTERGFKFDKTKAQQIEEELETYLVEKQATIEQLAGEEININSPKQLSTLLYDKRGVGKGKHIKLTKTGRSVNYDTLRTLAEEDVIIKEVLDWKENDVVRGRYANKLQMQAHVDGRIHAKITLLGAKHSGRLASSNPNLMAIPIRSEAGRRIRECFCASDGYVLLSFDYSQIEMRLMAHLADDERMIDAYKRGVDIHAETAQAIFRLPSIKDVEEMKHRHPAKRTSFGIVNDISAAGLQRELNARGGGNWTLEGCQLLLANWFKLYPGVAQRKKDLRLQILRHKYVADMWGRVEYLGEAGAADNRTREAGIRKGINQAIQSGAQGIIKEAMGLLWQQFRKAYNKGLWYPLLQIHDDLIFEVAEDSLPHIYKVTKDIMENCVKLKVPIVAEGKVGKIWGQLKPIKAS